MNRYSHTNNEETLPSRKGVTSLRRYWIMAACLLIFFLLTFFIIQAAGIGLLDEPTTWLKDHSALTAVLSVAILIADIVIPAPSSVIMVAHGALFGVWIGSLLSFIGLVGSAMAGFAIGRAGNDVIKRFVTPVEYDKASQLLQRWGAISIVITRPIPLLAETVSILAGASPLRWQAALLASVAGALPISILYAIAGVTTTKYANGLMIFILLMVAAYIVWRIGRR